MRNYDMFIIKNKKKKLYQASLKRNLLLLGCYTRLSYTQIK